MVVSIGKMASINQGVLLLLASMNAIKQGAIPSQVGHRCSDLPCIDGQRLNLQTVCINWNSCKHRGYAVDCVSPLIKTVLPLERTTGKPIYVLVSSLFGHLGCWESQSSVPVGIQRII